MRSIVLSVVVGLSVLGVACGGGNKEAASAESTKADLGPLDELRAIPGDLDVEVKSLTKPIDDTQAVIDKLTSIPKRYGISAGEMAAMAKGTLDNGKVEVKVNGNLAADARAEIEAALKQLGEIVAALKSTPDKVAALTTKLATITAKVPVLATKVSASASATMANPFGNAEGKATAKADTESLEKVKADVNKSVSDTQAKITGIPAMAAGALGKLTASLAGG